MEPLSCCIKPRSLFVLFVLVLFLVPAAASAFVKPDPSFNSLRDFDIRVNPSQARSLQAAQAVIPANIQEAINLLKSNGFVIDLQVRWSPFTSAPSRIYSIRGALSSPSAELPRTIATDFLANHLDLFNLSSNDISQTRFSRGFVTGHNGVRHMTIQQQVNGIDVFGGAVNINIDRDGRVLNISGEPIPGVAGIVNTGTPGILESEAFSLASQEANITNPSKTRSKGLVYFPLSMSEARLAWRVIVEDAPTLNVYDTLVDAVDGTVLWRQNLTQYASGLVYTSDSPDPDTPTGTSGCTPPPIPGPYPDCALDRALRPFDGSDFFGPGDDHYDWWHDGTGMSDAGTTKSNNVHAKEDQDHDDDDTEGFPTVSGGSFSFTVDLTLDPATETATVQNTSAAIVNAFYWINRIHDIYYSLGFDEAAGNFQSDNFTLGGVGNDAVEADLQDGGNSCNSGFSSSHTDGEPVRMSMYLCNYSTPRRDAAFENLIIFHEYTHGLVKRLVDIGAYYSQSGGLQDGTCDFMGLANTSEPGDDLTLNYPRGQWYYNNVNGNRRQPYSTNQNVFTRTYARISDDPDPWPAGEIWCNTLWMTRANLVWKHGFDLGGNTTLQLVVDGLKNAPDRPDYLDMRDSILQADTTNNGGANLCIIWDAFARMGMGVSAVSAGDSDSAPTEAFDVPAECIADLVTNVDTNFGQVCVGASQTRPIQMNSTGAGDLIVRSVSRVSGSTEITLDPLPHPLFISAGTSETLSARCAPTSCGPKTATFQIETNDPDQLQVDLTFTCDADTEAPAILCPADLTVECNQSTDPPNTGMATATDGCGAPTVTYADETLPGTCAQSWTITRTWTASDSCENSATCIQTINVGDTKAPVLSCNAPATVVPPDAPISFRATATDDCGDTTVEITDYDCFAFTKKGKRIDKRESCAVRISGSTVTIADSGGVDDTITWTTQATDSCGNVAEKVCEVKVVNPGKKGENP